MPNIPPALGKKVSTRTLSWNDQVQRAWGAEFNAADHGIYEFSKGRKFDSSDRGANSGLYAVDGYDYIMAENNYPDMRTEIQGVAAGDGPIHGTDIVRDT